VEQKQNRIAPEAATDEPASPFNPRHAQEPASPFAEPPLLSDQLDETLADIFPPGARKPRHDGWTPDAIAGFMHALATTGVVDHAARAVGLTAASAYAFRNRRQGRAFARMWDAVLVHRARARIASELQARAIAGCVSVRKKGGEVVSEYHYYDNRLAMSLLTRLDRLAEREAASEAQLRALSEDLDDYLDCIAAGEDADAFVESRKPADPEPEPRPAPAPGAAGAPDDDPDLTLFANLTGGPDYRDIDPHDIEVRDLDPTGRHDWSPDQWVRAYRSGFMYWLAAEDDPAFTPGSGAPLQYFCMRQAARANAEAADESSPEEAAAIDTSDLDTAMIWNWTDDQLARAWRSGFVERLPHEFWEQLADEGANAGEEQ
jgi:hypothetical protein